MPGLPETRFTTAKKFRIEVYWTLKQLLVNKPDELSESDFFMMLYLGLMDFTSERGKSSAGTTP